MKKIMLSIIGTLAVILIGGIGIFAYANSGNTDWRLEREKARLSLCSEIGDMTSSCYKGSAVDCGRMSVLESEYATNFNAEAYDDCVTKNIPAPGTVLPSGEIVESETGIPVQDNLDPLLFGDEEGNNY